MLTLGVDESGRGPCIGSMFMVGTLYEESKLKRLKDIGVKDSKLLPHKKRVELAKKIRKIANKVKVIQIKPEEIDDAVNRKDGLNLNWLEAVKTAEIINGLEPDKAIIDCPSPNIKAYTNFLRRHIKESLLNRMILVVEHKADVKYIECSSSSIIAKVAREQEVEKIEKIVGQSIGSGYTSNPICQKFLKENWEKYPELFRKTWISWKNHKNAKGQRKLEEF